MPRLFKQFIYGILFLLILIAIIGTAFYTLWPDATCVDNRKNQDEEGVDCGGLSCISCDLKNPEPLKIASVEIFDNNNATVTVLGEIRNPNQLLGAESFTYTVNIKDRNDKVIFSKERRSFVYPGKNRTVIEAGVEVPSSDAYYAEIMVDNVMWRAEEEFGGIPEKNLSVKKTSFRVSDGKFILDGELANNNPFQVGKIIVKAVLRDKNDLRQNASLTVIENLGAFQSKNFEIQVPVRKELMAKVNPDRTAVIIEIER